MKLACKSNGEGGSRGYVQVEPADSSRMRRIEAVGTVELVFVDGLLGMGVDSLLVLVWRSVGDGITGKRVVGCVGSYGKYLTTREPPWKQNGLPPIVNNIQIAHG